MATSVISLDTREVDRGFWAQLRRQSRAWVGGGLVLLVTLAAILAPLLSPSDPLTQNRDGLSDMGTPLPPNGQYLLGTDGLGRDNFTRLLYGAQVSLTISLTANLVAALLGLLVGVLAGYFGGWLDTVLMRLTDVLLAFPAVLLALGLGSVLRPSITTVTVILAIITWPALARLVRSQVLQVRERQFVESARSVGASDARLIFRHILPHTVPTAVIWASLSIASSVLVESSLSFLGVGVPLPTPSWGNMIFEGQRLYRIAPWLIIYPTLAILLVTLGFNLLGDAIRDALDPRTMQRQS